MIKKYLLFLEDCVSDDRLIKWFANSKYEVIIENDDHYILPDQNHQKCGIGKTSEGIKYEVLEIEVDNG